MSSSNRNSSTPNRGSSPYSTFSNGGDSNHSDRVDYSTANSRYGDMSVDNNIRPNDDDMDDDYEDMQSPYTGNSSTVPHGGQSTTGQINADQSSSHNFLSIETPVLMSAHEDPHASNAGNRGRKGRRKTGNGHTVTNAPTSAANLGYTWRGYRKRNKVKVPIQYDYNDISEPFPDDYVVACFLDGRFFVATILGHKPLTSLNQTIHELLQEGTENPDNIIPQPYPPETLPYDYDSHPCAYYVHFHRWDRRLDQWVSRSRLRCFVELVRYMQPYSLQPNAVGRSSSVARGYYLQYPVVQRIHQRYPYVKAILPSATTTATTPSPASVTPPSKNSSPPNDYVNPIAPASAADSATNPLQQGGGSKPPPLPPPPDDPQTQFLIPFIVPDPLPIVPVLPPGILSNKKLTDAFELHYEETACYTLHLVLNTPLGQPATNTMSTSNCVWPQTNNSTTNKKKKSTTAAASVDTEQHIVFPDGWKGPNYNVELPEVALLHFGPDDEEDEHLRATRFKTVFKAVLGKWQLSPWYFSPYPSEYCISGTVWLCEHCLSPFAYEEELTRHTERCTLFHPPGDEIYRSKENNIEICMFEVDGAKEVTYCENLSYLAKLFLDHKTLWDDCSIFFFYILCEMTPKGAKILGYFSKEKDWTTNNLACILTLPQYQGHSYGKFLISFSYELAKIEQRVGGPERPLSDLGRVSYIAYWTESSLRAIECILASRRNNPRSTTIKTSNNYNDLASSCPVLASCGQPLLDKVSVSIEDISRLTSINVEDLFDALIENNILVYSSKESKWCLNVTNMRSILERAVARKNQKEERFKRAPADQRAKYQSIRYAVPSRIRWEPHVPASALIAAPPEIEEEVTPVRNAHLTQSSSFSSRSTRTRSHQ